MHRIQCIECHWKDWRNLAILSIYILFLFCLNKVKLALFCNVSKTLEEINLKIRFSFPIISNGIYFDILFVKFLAMRSPKPMVILYRRLILSRKRGLFEWEKNHNEKHIFIRFKSGHLTWNWFLRKIYYQTMVKSKFVISLSLTHVQWHTKVTYRCIGP